MKRTNPQKTILANDPSIRAWGWAVLDTQGNLIDHGCIKTEPCNKKLKIRKGDDRTRRIDEIYQKLLEVIEKHNVVYIVTEQPHGSQNSSAAVMIGITLTILQSFSSLLKIGVEWYSENDSKRSALGKGSGSKDEMINRMNEVYDVDWAEVKYVDEAVADALAIHYIAMKESAMLKLLKQQ